MQKIICKVFFCLVILSFVLAFAFADPRRGSAGVPIRGGTSVPELDVQDGNITNVGDIALDSISSDAGTSINVTLGANAGDDFIIDTTGFVYKGDTNRVGIGTMTPNNLIQVANLINFDNIDYNTKLGYQAGLNIVSGAQYNTFIGYQAGLSSVGGSTNTADYNTAVGYRSLYYNTTGYQNSAMGMNALLSNTTGIYNSAMGVNTLFSNTTGNYNAAMGMKTLFSNTTGNYNAAMGMYALLYNATGNYNVAMGYNALYSNTTGNYNLAMGMNALYNVKPTSKAITAFADYGATVAGTVKATSVAHGLPTGATANIAISGTINYNGVYTVTYIDVDNFYFTDTWVSNDATGWWSKDTEGRYNTGIGYGAGDNITTGSNNLIIGYNVDAPSATADNQLNIGNAIYGDLSTGNVGIGTTSPTSLLTVAGPISTQAPATKTAAYSMIATDSSLIFNGTASSILTLQAASSYTGRILYVKTIAAFTVDSASANVVPLGSSTAGTAILAATAGKWAMLQSDGTNWVIMAGN